jgi:hypothetical protein
MSKESGEEIKRIEENVKCQWQRHQPGSLISSAIESVWRKALAHQSWHHQPRRISESEMAA